MSDEPTGCPTSEELLRFVRSALRGPRAYAVASHVANCPACLEALESLSQVPVHTTAEEEWVEGAPAPVGPVGSDRSRDGRWHELRGLLGEGGMGTVHEVFDRDLRRAVAMKTMSLGEASSLREQHRFVEEAQITGQLAHPNIVPVYELGWTPEGEPYFTMKRIEGRSAADLLDALADGVEDPGDWPLARRLGVFGKICDAVAFAHSRGVVHRDLKPGNVMLGDFGEVLVVDWGLAAVEGRADGGVRTDRADERDVDPLLRTRADSVLGTPAYMAPEQARGDLAAIGPWSDVYGLGGILFSLLTLRAPTDAPGGFQSSDRVPWELQAIANKAMAEAPGERYEGAAALAADVDQWLAGRFVEAVEYGSVRASLKWLRLHWRPVAAAVLAVAVGVAAWAVPRARRIAALRGEVASLSETLTADVERVVGALDAGGSGSAAEQPLPEGQVRAAAELASRLERLLGALDRLAAESPDAAVARARRLRLGQLARLALESRDYTLAQAAVLRARAAGASEARVAALTKAIERSRLARQTAQLAAVEGLLAQARDGALVDDVAYRAALVQLVAYGGPQTRARLERALASVAGTLEEAYVARLVQAGAGLEGVEAAARAWRATYRARAAARRRQLGRFEGGVLRAAFERLVPAGGDEERDRVEQATPVLTTALARALAREGWTARAIQLVCEGLGLIGDPESRGVLSDYLAAELDARRSVWAGEALARLARRDAESLKRLLAIAGMNGDALPIAPGYWWDRVSRGLQGVDFGADGAGSALLQQVQVHLSAARYVEAEAALERAGAGREARLLRVTLYRLSGRSAEALTLLDGLRGEGVGGLAYERALVLQSLGRRSEAREAAREAVSAAGARANALALCAQLEMEMGAELGAVRALLDRAIRQDPQSVRAYMVRATLHSREGKTERALEDARTAYRLDPRSPGTSTKLALLYRRQGETRKALELFDQAIARETTDASVYVERGRTRQAIGDPEGALADARKALTMTGARVPALLLIGEIQIGRRQLREAIDTLTRAADAAQIPYYRGLAYSYRGLARYKLGDAASAVADHAESLKAIAGTNVAVPVSWRLNYAAALVDQRQVAEALRQVAAAKAAGADRNPAEARMYFRTLAKAETGRRNWRAAKAALDRCLEIAPRQASALLARSRCLRALGDAASAWRDVQRALALAPEFPQINLHAIASLGDLGRWEEATPYGDRAVARNPKNPQAFVQRGIVHSKCKRYAKAVEDFTRAAKLYGRPRADVLVYRGESHQAAGQLERAIADFQRATVVRPQWGLTFYRLGQALLAAGRPADAVAPLEKAYRMAPRQAKAEVAAALKKARGK